MGRIILAEDEEISGTIASSALMNAGHAVGWFKDGKEVLAAMVRRPPNLAILDCNMPGMSGVLVLREMRRRADLCEVPVLMLSGRTSDSDERIARFAVPAAAGWRRRSPDAKARLTFQRVGDCRERAQDHAV